MMLKSSMQKPLNSFIKQVLLNFSITLPTKIEFAKQHGHLTNDSRTIQAGDIFCAIIGYAQDGRQYIGQAITSGAKLVLSECETADDHGNVLYSHTTNDPVAVISFYQLNKHLFSLASAYYQAPEKSMTMIGITGTNGKTSTSQLLGQLLTNSQKPCAIIGTNGAGLVDDLQTLENTTPSATDLMQLFYRFSHSTINDTKISHLAMEVSSHALEQNRVTASTFDIAIFTNLSREHLDYHGTMADYAAAKKKLFTQNNQQVTVLNGDDNQAQTWLKYWPAAETKSQQNIWLYGRNESIRQYSKFVSCANIKHHQRGVDFILNTHLGDIAIRSPLLGDFNVDNLLAAIAVLLIEGISLAKIAEKITDLKAIAGRMEAFSSVHEQAPTAVVDYAHTPDALEKALIACRQHCHGNLSVVFGCGGDRDKGKRPLMAQAAEKYADYLVITNDNPRTEKPMDIIDDILAGLKKVSKAQVTIDRKQAVLDTLVNAKAGDVILFAGKGHENYIILGHEKIDYNERAIVQNYFDNYEHNLIELASAGELQ
jgi:UDP-N-acetylmuramoyl-L-alanyl-D-glutamate--2,6-diaminopimelate ligase